MSHKEKWTIINTFLQFLVAIITVLISIGITLADAIFFPDVKFTELGFVELSQSLFLLIASGLYILAAKKSHSTFYILVSGFLACMLIREQDYFLGHKWFYFALTAAMIFIIYGFRHGYSRVLTDISRGVIQNSFCWLFAGAIVVLVFSRLFGMNFFWHTVLGNGYSYAIKQASEETLELWGYTLIMTSAILQCSVIFLKSRKISTQFGTKESIPNLNTQA